MSSQREAFEECKYQNNVYENNPLSIQDMSFAKRIDGTYKSLATEYCYTAWQAAQADQAEDIAMLELNNKFKDDAIAQLQAKLDTILITAEALANEERMSQPQRDVMAGFVAGVKEALGEIK